MPSYFPSGIQMACGISTGLSGVMFDSEGYEKLLKIPGAKCFPNTVRSHSDESIVGQNACSLFGVVGQSEMACPADRLGVDYFGRTPVVPGRLWPIGHGRGLFRICKAAL